MNRYIRFIPAAVLIIQYTLGLSAAHYLGNSIDSSLAASGFMWLMLIVVGSWLLALPFSPDFHSISRKWPEPFKSKPTAAVNLTAVFVFLLAVSINFLQFNNGAGSINYLIFTILIALYFIFENSPPLRINKSIFAEFGFASVLGVLVPAYAFILQNGDIHRILAMVSFPTVFLLFSHKIILGLESFIPDQKDGSKSFLQSLGWETGIFWHNVSSLTAYLLLAIAVYFQLAIRLAWPVFVTLPLFLYLFMQLRRIQQGIKPNWNTLLFTSFLVYFAFVYLLFFGMVFI